MTIEEMKMLVDMISTLGMQGKEAFIWWVVLDKIPPFIIWILSLATVCFIANKLYKTALESTQAHQDLRNVATLLGVSIEDEYRFQWVPKLEKAILKLKDDK